VKTDLENSLIEKKIVKLDVQSSFKHNY